MNPSTRRLIGLVALVLAALVVAGLAVYLVGRGGPAGSAGPSPTSTSRSRYVPPAPPTPTQVLPPQADMLVVAQNYVDAVNVRDVAAATALVCSKTTPDAGVLYPDEPNTTLSLGAVLEQKRRPAGSRRSSTPTSATTPFP